MSNVAPNVDGDIPLCSERCPSHDGKRCEVMGMRPDRICEPAVVSLHKLLGAVIDWRSLRDDVHMDQAVTIALDVAAEEALESLGVEPNARRRPR